MGRLDHKRGRFNVSYETTMMAEGLRGRQAHIGERVQWYRFDSENTVIDDLFDEGGSGGKVYRGPFRVPVLHVTHSQGANTGGGLGFYTNDTLSVTASFDQVARFLGLTDRARYLNNDEFLRDRLVYDGAVFRITGMAILGQIQNRDVIVSIDATQVKPDELVNDAQFQPYSS